MPTRVKCRCGRTLVTNDRPAGSAIKCPACGVAMTVPTSSNIQGAASKSSEPDLDALVRMIEPAAMTAPLAQAETQIRPRSSASWIARNALWCVPLIACVVFAILIAGGLTVRRAIVRSNAAPTESSEQPKTETPAASLEPSDTTPTSAPSTSADRVEPALESTESGFEVIPPAAARAPCRTLRKMLVVGDGPGMFPYLEDAVELAIPGDIVEIRTNGPLLVGAAEIRRSTREADEPVTIRAGSSFSPVLRLASTRQMFTFVNADALLAGLHFVSHNGDAPWLPVIELVDSSLEIRDCTATSMSPISEGFVRIQRRPTCADPLRVEFTNCYIRGNLQAVDVSGPSVSIGVRQSAFMHASTYGAVFLQPILENQRVEFDSSTIIGTTLQISVTDEIPKVPPEIQVRRGLYAGMWGGSTFLRVYIPQDHSARSEDDYRGALLSAFSKFDASDSWGTLVHPAYVMQVGRGNEEPLSIGVMPAGPFSLPRTLPEGFGPPNFGPAMETTSQAMSDYFFKRIDMPTWRRAIASVMPRDLALDAANGVAVPQGYGVDPTLLPIPPDSTLADFDPTELVLIEVEHEPLRATSEGLKAGRDYQGAQGKHVSWFGTDQALFARATQPGEWFELALRVPKPGTYRVQAHCAQGPDCGGVRFTSAGSLLDAQADLYAAEDGPAPAVDVGSVDVRDGELILRATATGKNQRSNGYRIAIDYVTLRRIVAP